LLRDHCSLDGVATATAVDSGKVIDMECLSKYCTHLQKGNEDYHEHTTNYILVIMEI
jgi:hypothetical protein